MTVINESGLYSLVLSSKVWCHVLPPHVDVDKLNCRSYGDCFVHRMNEEKKGVTRCYSLADNEDKGGSDFLTPG